MAENRWTGRSGALPGYQPPAQPSARQVGSVEGPSFCGVVSCRASAPHPFFFATCSFLFCHLLSIPSPPL